jgi:hypothetical protein
MLVKNQQFVTNTLDQVHDFLERQIDVMDGPDGAPQPNTAMKLAMWLRAVMLVLEREFKQ